VGDHCAAIRRVLDAGRIGETYNIGGCNEKTNLEVVHALCALLDERHPGSPVTPHARLVQFVKDRPGHDARYAIDASKIERTLGWRPAESFESGIRKTLDWYLAHTAWVDAVVSGEYRQWLDLQYGARA
jgi:dTDP-glucose 4,6-dehydratase